MIIRTCSKGSSLLLVLFVILFTSILIGLLIEEYIFKVRTTRYRIDAAKAYYMAESGIKKVMFKVVQDKNFRTGDLLNDSTVSESLFWDRPEQAQISVIDLGGFLRVTSRARAGLARKTVTAMVGAQLPQALRHSLVIASQKPLILRAGARIAGSVRLNQNPVYLGGAVEGLVDVNPNATLPALNTTCFNRTEQYFVHRLSAPQEADLELHSPQVFGPQREIPRVKRIFVNDFVLIENRNPDSAWTVLPVEVMSTAEIQVAGNVVMDKLWLCAVGPIRVLDRARIRNGLLYSTTSVEIREFARFSGIIIAPQVTIGENSVIYPATVIQAKEGFEIVGNAEASASIFVTGRKSSTAVSVGPDATIRGLLYSSIPVNCEGRIQGHVFVRSFYGPAVSQDTANHNVLTGEIGELPGSADVTIPCVFEEIDHLKVLSYQE